MIICLADKIINVKPIYSYLEKYCMGYLLPEKENNPDVDFKIITTSDDIEFERNKSEKEDIAEGHEIRIFSDEYLETLAVYRKIAEEMPEYDTILFHGSVIAVDGIGYLFTASSGTGKSTHARLWREYFGERAVMVNDDKPLLKITQDGVTAYGTPWDGKHRLSSNIAVPLKAICILERGRENHISEAEYKDAFPMLLQQTYRPSNSGKMAKTIQLVEKLGKTVNLYRLSCNMDPEAARIAYEMMKV